MVSPATGLTERVHVRPAKKECLHVHLLDVELSRNYFAMHPLMARVESARMAAHRDQPGLLLQIDYRLCIAPRVSERDLDLHMLPGLKARERLLCMHLRRRAKNDRV